MAHKIDGVGSSPGPLAKLTADVAARAPASSGKPVSDVAPTDSARLTGDATGLAQLQQDLAQNPSMDVAKVNAVRAAIESGSYRIDAQAIADRMIQLERDLGA